MFNLNGKENQRSSYNNQQEINPQENEYSK
jgi:hypothetical protein